MTSRITSSPATVADVEFDKAHDGRPNLTHVQDGTSRTLSISANLGNYRVAVDSFAPNGETNVTFYTTGRRLPEGAKVLDKRVVRRAYGAVLVAEYVRLIAELETLRPDHSRLSFHKGNAKEHADCLADMSRDYDVEPTAHAVAGLAKAVRLAKRLAGAEGVPAFPTTAEIERTQMVKPADEYRPSGASHPASDYLDESEALTDAPTVTRSDLTRLDIIATSPSGAPFYVYTHGLTYFLGYEVKPGEVTVSDEWVPHGFGNPLDYLTDDGWTVETQSGLIEDSPELPEDFYQDGADFYSEERGHIWTAPIAVGMDSAKATRARKLFLEFIADARPCYLTINGRPLCDHTGCMAGVSDALKAGNPSCSYPSHTAAAKAASAWRDANPSHDVQIVAGECPALAMFIDDEDATDVRPAEPYDTRKGRNFAPLWHSVLHGRMTLAEVAADCGFWDERTCAYRFGRFVARLTAEGTLAAFMAKGEPVTAPAGYEVAEVDEAGAWHFREPETLLWVGPYRTRDAAVAAAVSHAAP